MTTADEMLLTERQASTLWITINRAAKANALTVDLMDRITAAIVATGGDDSVHAVLLTGAGERAFCAGVDVREPPADGEVARHRERRSFALAALQDAVLDTPKPIIAVLNGTASGGGAMLALLADACVAVDTAQLSLPEIDLGIVSFSGASILEIIGGRALALDLIQTARRMPAGEAAARGFIAAVAARAGLHAAAMSLAETLGAKKRHAFADNKRWINRALKTALAEARDEHARHRARIAT